MNDLPGLPALLLPADLLNLLRHPLGAAGVAPISAIPDRDDESSWAALRRRALYIWPDHAADHAVSVALEKGCTRVAILDPHHLPDPYEAGLCRESFETAFAEAKMIASSRATTADLSLIEAPAGQPMAIPFGLFGPMAENLKAAAWYAGTPPDFLAGAALPVMSGITGGMLEVHISDGHRQPVILSSALLGAPGANKTGAMRAFEPIFEAIENRLHDQHCTRQLAWEAASEGLPKGSRQEKPIRKLVRLTDFTTEAMSVALARNERGLCGWIPEFAALSPHLGLCGSESGYSKTGSLRAALLQAMLDGGSSLYTRRSVGDEPLRINQFAMSLCTTAQPDVFAEVLRHPLRDGFGDRFLISNPLYQPSADRGVKPNIPFHQLQEQLSGSIQRLYEASTTLGEGHRKLIQIPFESQATTAWGVYSRQMKVRASAMNDHVAGARIKATTFVATMAGLGAFIRHVLEGAPLIVTAEIFAQAVEMMRAFMDHRAVAEACAFEPIDERRARALARAIVSRDCTLVDTVEVRRNWRITNLRTEMELRSALVELQLCGWLRNGSPIPRNPREPLPSRVEIDPLVLREARALLK